MEKKLKPHQIQAIKARYTPGTRIELNEQMVGERMPAGARGTVSFVDDIGNIHMKWDGGGSLALIPNVDDFKVITPEYEEANPARIVKRLKQHER